MLLPAPTLSTVVFWQVLGPVIREKISCVLIRSRTSYPRSEHTRINIGGPIQCVVLYRDQCAHKHTNMSLY